MRIAPLSTAAFLVVAIALIVASSGRAEDAPEPEGAVEVHVTTIAPKLLERHLTLYGQIVPEPAGPARPAAAASLSPSAARLVAAVPAVEGRLVEKGEIVVHLDSRQADAEVERARAALTQATAEAERQQRLSEHDDSSAKQRERAERELAESRAALAEAQTARDYLDIRAPLRGTVVRVDVRPGEVVDPADVLVEIVDLDRLLAEVRVPAAELAKLRVGQTAEVQAAGLEVDGRVAYVSPRVDPSDGTAAARIEVTSARGLHPGDFARASVVIESRPDALAVPTSAVVYGDEGIGTVAAVDGGRARLLPVKLGIEDGDWVEIEGDGIRAGVRIVTLEAYGLPDDTPVRPVQEKAGR